MLQVINPASGKLVTELKPDTLDSISAKVAQAKAAQILWSSEALSERIKTISRFGALLVGHLDELSKTLTEETGKPITQARAEISATGERIQFFIDHVADVMETQNVTPKEGRIEERIEHEALGVIANVSAWNYPYFVGGNVFVPALLTGNAFLYKPSEFATLSGLKIAELLHQAGVPKEIFSCIVGDGGAGQLLLDQPIDGLFFTGSYLTGKKIAKQVAEKLIVMQLELGGKDPVYVTDDIDVAKVAASVADGAFYNAGQSCCSVERIYVHEKVYDAFVEQFLSHVKSFVIGDPMDEKTYIGPLTREAQLTLLAEQVRDATQKGAKLLCGGQRLLREGRYFSPTVLDHVNHSMQVMRDESFGPIIGIQRVASDEQAVLLMNDTEYGLTAGVYAKDQKRATSILSKVSAGTVYWNCCDRVSPRLPWTGRKHSGIGSTLSLAGIRAFLQPKAWHLRAIKSSG